MFKFVKKVVIIGLVMSMIINLIRQNMIPQNYAKNAVNKMILTTKTNKSANKMKKSKYLVVRTNKEIISTYISRSEAKKLEKDSSIICVERDGKVKASSKISENNNGIKQSEWNFQAVKADEVKISPKKKQRNVRVAVIDSGIDSTNELNVVDRI